MNQVPERTTVIDDNGALISWAMGFLHIPSEMRDDARQGGAVGLLEALNRYDPAKGRFPSYAASFVLQETRSSAGWNRRPTVILVDIDDPMVEARVAVRVAKDHDRYDRLERGEAIAATGDFLDSLDKVDRDLLRRLYEDGVTQTEIARDLGSNKMAISRRVAKLHAKARLALAPYADAA